MWNLAHEAVACVAPTLIQEPGADAKPIERKREELAAVPAEPVLTDDEVAEIRAIGDNRGSMLLKGATPDHEGEERPDRWELATSTPSWRRAGASTPSATCAGTRRPSAGLGPLQQLGAELEGLGVLRARLVEAVRVLMEVLGLGGRAVVRGRRGRRGPVRPPSPGRVAASAERLVRSESGRGIRGRLDLLLAVHVRELDLELDRAGLNAAQRLAALLGHLELDLARPRAG